MTEEPLARELKPALTIEIRIDSACCYIRATGSGTPFISRNYKFDKNKLAKQRERAKKALGEFSEALRSGIASGNPRVPVRQSMLALRELQDFGFGLLLSLIGQKHREKVPQLVELAVKSIYGAGVKEPTPVLRWDAIDGRPPLIVFKTSVDDGIPIDVIPLLNLYDKPPLSDDFRDLGKYACSFLGFCGIVKREISDSLGPCRYLENVPQLPIKMFINRSLPGPRKEEKTLKENTRLHIEHGWPHGSEPSQANFAGELAKHLWEVKTRFGGPLRHHPDQICHFSCHSRTDIDRTPEEYEIALQGDQFLGGSRTATLEKLRNALAALSHKARDDRAHRPLIFMNSCGSGDLDPSGASSFPDLFMNSDLGFTGFIGTETVMPNDIAAEFSIKFYERLIKGDALGEAILLTRWDMLADYHNPLGLMYTLVAEPEIRVRSPVKEVSVPAPGIVARILASLRGTFRLQN